MIRAGGLPSGAACRIKPPNLRTGGVPANLSQSLPPCRKAPGADVSDAREQDAFGRLGDCHGGFKSWVQISCGRVRFAPTRRWLVDRFAGIDQQSGPVRILSVVLVITPRHTGNP